MFRLGRCVPSKKKKKKKFRSVWIMIGTCMSCLIDQIISLALLKLIRKVRQELFLYIIDQLANLTKMCQTSSSTLSKQHYRNCCKGFREVCLSIVGQPICSWTYIARQKELAVEGSPNSLYFGFHVQYCHLWNFFINICTQ